MHAFFHFRITKMEELYNYDESYNFNNSDTFVDNNDTWWFRDEMNIATLDLLLFRITHHLRLINTEAFCEHRFNAIVPYPGTCSCFSTCTP